MAPKVLIVCLGNICRSPMGEAVLKKVAKDRDIDILVDSAGTGAYHIGEEPDERTTATCEKVRRAEVKLWGSYLDDKSIPDPYYGGIKGFEGIYHQCVGLSKAFLNTLSSAPSASL